jgi:hypothetical protein
LVIDKLTPRGTINVRRAYGNWKHLPSWEEKLQPFALQPIQQFAYTKGKNAVDICMTMDAMELLLSDRIDTFALVTSDSDFTPLVMRLLARGRQVFGFGESKTPESFKRACSQFIHTDAAPAPVKSKRRSDAELCNDAPLMRLLRAAIESGADADGVATMTHISRYLETEFDVKSKTYGYKRWRDLIRATNRFTEVQTSSGLGFKCTHDFCESAPLPSDDSWFEFPEPGDVPYDD